MVPNSALMAPFCTDAYRIIQCCLPVGVSQPGDDEHRSSVRNLCGQRVQQRYGDPSIEHYVYYIRYIVYYSFYIRIYIYTPYTTVSHALSTRMEMVCQADLTERDEFEFLSEALSRLFYRCL